MDDWLDAEGAGVDDAAAAHRDWSRMQRDFSSVGYVDGVESGRGSVAQASFNAGFAAAALRGATASRSRSLVSALVSFYEPRPTLFPGPAADLAAGVQLRAALDAAAASAQRRPSSVDQDAAAAAATHALEERAVAWLAPLLQPAAAAAP